MNFNNLNQDLLSRQIKWLSCSTLPPATGPGLPKVLLRDFVPVTVADTSKSVADSWRLDVQSFKKTSQLWVLNLGSK